MSLTGREKEIFRLLKLDPTVSREEIAEKLNISSSAVGTHIHNLNKKGYIKGKGYIISPEKKIVVVGGSNFDLKGYPFMRCVRGSSSPGFINESLGGVARNIAENLALLDVNTILLTAVGEDHYGKVIINETMKPSLNLNHVVRTTRYNTGKYMVCLNSNGDLLNAISDMEIMKEITPEFLQKNSGIMENASYLVIDTNLMKESIYYLLKLAEAYQITTVVDTVSVDKSNKIKNHIDKIDILTPNLDEILNIFDIEKKTDVLDNLDLIKTEYQKRGLDLTILVSMGRNGVFLINENEDEYIPALPLEYEKYRETTGAGDALTAGFVYGLIEGKDLKEAARIGMKAARVALMTERTVNLRLKRIML